MSTGALSTDGARCTITTALVIVAALAIIGFTYAYVHSVGSREYSVGRLAARAAVALAFLTALAALLLHSRGASTV